VRVRERACKSVRRMISETAGKVCESESEREREREKGTFSRTISSMRLGLLRLMCTLAYLALLGLLG
jgi:hypothetical protein